MIPFKLNNQSKTFSLQVLAVLVVLVFIPFQWALYAQTADGNNGLNQANTLIRSYFDTATQLLYGIAALMGLIGAVEVYRNMKKDGQQTGHHVAAWFGGCLFLVIAATVLKSFFGL